MIAVDTSALIAILLGETLGARCEKRLEIADVILVSAGTLAEALLVAQRRVGSAAMARLVDDLDVTVIDVDEDEARRVADAHARWGRGGQTAALNFGDCFAYAIARRYNCPLLFVGDDFSRTDIVSALLE